MSILCKLYKIDRKPKFSIINFIIKEKIDNGELNEEEYYIINDNEDNTNVSSCLIC